VQALVRRVLPADADERGEHRARAIELALERALALGQPIEEVLERVVEVRELLFLAERRRLPEVLLQRELERVQRALERLVAARVDPEERPLVLVLLAPVAEALDEVALPEPGLAVDVDDPGRLALEDGPDVPRELVDLLLAADEAEIVELLLDRDAPPLERVDEDGQVEALEPEDVLRRPLVARLAGAEDLLVGPDRRPGRLRDEARREVRRAA
jgi:hypothetical protein